MFAFCTTKRDVIFFTSLSNCEPCPLLQSHFTPLSPSSLYSSCPRFVQFVEHITCSFSSGPRYYMLLTLQVSGRLFPESQRSVQVSLFYARTAPALPLPFVPLTSSNFRPRRERALVHCGPNSGLLGHNRRL